MKLLIENFVSYLLRLYKIGFLKHREYSSVSFIKILNKITLFVGNFIVC